MSPEKLAIELAKQEKGSPPYILLEHELNLQLAKEQSKATLSSGWLGLIGSLSASLLGVVLGYFIGMSSPAKEVKQESPGQVCRCQCDCQVQQPVAVLKPQTSSPVVQGRKNVDIKSSGSNSNQEPRYGNAKP